MFRVMAGAAEVNTEVNEFSKANHWNKKAFCAVEKAQIQCEGALNEPDYTPPSIS